MSGSKNLEIFNTQRSLLLKLQKNQIEIEKTIFRLILVLSEQILVFLNQLYLNWEKTKKT